MGSAEAVRREQDLTHPPLPGPALVAEQEQPAASRRIVSAFARTSASPVVTTDELGAFAREQTRSVERLARRALGNFEKPIGLAHSGNVPVRSNHRMSDVVRTLVRNSS